MRKMKWILMSVLICCLLAIAPAALAELELEVTEAWPCASEYGETVYVSVQATGASANAKLSYVWYYADKNSATFKKASITGKTYEVELTSTRNGRRIYCVVTDQYGNMAVSDTYKLCLDAAELTITKQPVSVTVANGKTATVTVAAEGTGLTYKWYYKNAGASKFVYTSSFTGSSYSIKMNAERAGRQVYCVITDAAGNKVTTKTVTLSMATLKITTQPKDVTVASGKAAKVTVAASGEGLKYQWYYANKGSSKFSKASITSATYSVTMNSTRAGRRVYCVITDQYGNKVTTNTVTLGMASGITVTKQPVSVTVNDGETAKVTVSATGTGLTYKWYYKNAGATKFTYTSTFKGNSYSITMNGSRAGRQVYCVITDAAGNSVKTNTVTLGMKAVALSITQQPQSVTVAADEKATVTVEALGSGLKYQWYYKDQGAASFALTTAFTGKTYSVTMNSDRAGRQVYCVVTDAAGNSVKTNTVTLDMEAEEIPEGLEYEIFEGRLQITGYTGSATTLVIPAKIGGKQVVEIAESAFHSSKLKEITVPEGVTTISMYAFVNCTALEKISLPSTLKNLSTGAFDGCKALKNITIPDSVTYIGIMMFCECDNLEVINLGNGIDKITDMMFVDCTGLTTYVIPSNITKIDTYAFAGCTNLTALYFPESVTYIDEDFLGPDYDPAVIKLYVKDDSYAQNRLNEIGMVNDIY